jgi:asparagine synthase (glutamine-hydrolysing)
VCGLVAIRSEDEPVAILKVGDALTSMAHRGPDGRGVLSLEAGRVVLGHVRLALRDLEGGAQPIASEDGQVVAVVNGEVYRAGRLAAELASLGHRLRTKSDSELVVHAWEEWGTGMFSRLDGELAFALWDGRERILVAGRDRFGVKPLAYAVRNGQTMIASRASALLALGVPARWDEVALSEAASFQYTAPHRTLFEGIAELPPGHFLVARRGEIRVERYWDLDYLAENEARSEAARELRERLDDAVMERLAGDAPVAFQLSGGIDSSAVLASAAHHRVAPLHAFTVSFDGGGAYDEVDVARRTATALGAELHVVRISDDDVADSFAEAVAHAESVCINAHAAAKLRLSRALRDAGFKAVLTGEGADEVFLGYAHLRSDALGDGARVAPTNAASSGLMLPHEGAGALSTDAIESALGFVPTWVRAKATLGHKVHALLAPDVRAFDPAARLLAPFDVERALRGRPRVLQAAYLWTKLALEGYILRALGDGLEMANGVEGRLPFLDREVFELARRLPVDVMIRDGVEKWVLREAMRGRLPEEVRCREKHPFLAPPMGPRTLAALKDVISSAAFARQPLFDPTRVRALLDRVDQMGTTERKAYDPVFFFVLSIAALEARFRISA